MKDRGAVAPGLRADLVVLNDLEQFSVEQVIKNGKVVVKQGKRVDFPHTSNELSPPPTFQIAPFSSESFEIKVQGNRARVIELIPDQILTKMRIEEIRSSAGLVASDTRADILKLAVLERHRATGNIGTGLVKGFGLKMGAIASSVAHDSHNIIVAGVDDADLYLAAKNISEMGGSLVVVGQGRILAKAPLEIAGLMTQAPLQVLAERLSEIEKAAFSLGCKIQHPFMQLAFLALPVIPELKLTDKGLVDVGRFEIVPLFQKE